MSKVSWRQHCSTFEAAGFDFSSHCHCLRSSQDQAWSPDPMKAVNDNDQSFLWGVPGFSCFFSVATRQIGGFALDYLWFTRLEAVFCGFAFFQFVVLAFMAGSWCYEGSIYNLKKLTKMLDLPYEYHRASYLSVSFGFSTVLAVRHRR